MRYVTAFPVVLLLLVLDLVVVATIFFPIILVDKRPAWPYSVGFARRVWLNVD